MPLARSHAGVRSAAGGWQSAVAGLLIALGTLIFGCGSSEATGDPGPGPSDSRVVLGTGEAEFETMDGEPQIRLVHGAQGGFHVWASFLAYGFTSQALDLLLTTSVEGASEPMVMHARLSTREIVDADGVTARSFAGFPAQVRDARCADGLRVELQLHLSEAGGAAAEDARHCIAEVDEEFRAAQCP